MQIESGLPLGVARYFPVDFVSVGDTEKPRIERIHRRVEHLGHFRDLVHQQERSQTTDRSALGRFSLAVRSDVPKSGEMPPPGSSQCNGVGIVLTFIVPGPPIPRPLSDCLVLGFVAMTAERARRYWLGQPAVVRWPGRHVSGLARIVSASGKRQQRLGISPFEATGPCASF
jgi:hypothetical protein